MLVVAVLLMMPPPLSAQSDTDVAEATTTESSVAQSSKVEMADVMRQNGKIYVVVAVILLVFSGLIAYLFRIDRKVRHLEKELS